MKREMSPAEEREFRKDSWTVIRYSAVSLAALWTIYHSLKHLSENPNDYAPLAVIASFVFVDFHVTYRLWKFRKDEKKREEDSTD